MPGYGREILNTTGRSLAVSADGKPDWKAIGITLDWATVTAVSGADVTLADGAIVKIGDKYIRYGTVLDLIGTAEVQTATWTGGPTAGSAILTLPASGDQPAQATAAIAFDASAAVFQAAIAALPRIGVGGATVTRAGAGSAGDPYVYTITFNAAVGNVPQFTSTHTFTGGTTPTATHATGTPGVGTGLWGPVDTSASDGRQTMARGETYILNETVVKSEPGSDHPAVFEGGLVYADRLVVNGTNQPTLANLLTAMPNLRLVK